MIGMSTVLIVGLVILLFGLYLIVSYAFRSQGSWAWAILFLPVLYPVYSVLRWGESKVRNGFLISVIGILLVMTAAYGGALRELQMLTREVSDGHLQGQLQELSTKLPQARPTAEVLPNEEEASAITFPEDEHYDPIYGDESFTYDALEPLSPNEDVQVSAPKAENTHYAYRQIELIELDSLHGRQLKLITKKGDTKEGRLIDSKKDSLFLEIPLNNGFAAFEYKFDNIGNVLVYDALKP